MGQAEDKKGRGNDNKNQQANYDTELDEFATCGPAFKLLSELVEQWHSHKEYSKNLGHSFNASMILSNFYRWLSTPSTSKLYDPLLYRLVHKLMKKNFF